MCPWSGFISPRQSFRIVLFPDPATPSRALVSPRLSSKETPSRTTWSSKLMATSSKIIVLCTVSTGKLLLDAILKSGEGQKEFCKHHIYGQDEHRCRYYCLSG